ncbi:MAG: molybdenum cofactor biosynthesis protein MoaE, partial [Saprospiraceae bacterium]|nr:molybdenum cofactor biosynthesis protein MoaE [Saprospiraceae bacterium]
IAKAIEKHSTKLMIGAHDIFLGQVRSDQIDEKNVVAIEYSANPMFADKVMQNIREETFEKYRITCMHVHHSLGRVSAGEICLFVFVSAAHRHTAFEATRYLVERIKKELPVWGKELFMDESYQWKTNTL